MGFSLILLVLLIVVSLAFFLLRSPGVRSRTIIAPPLSSDEILIRAMRYRLGDVSDRIAELSYPGFASGAELEQELRRFLAVLATSVDTDFRLPDDLREPWRLLVAEHKIYHGVTQALLGEGGAIETQTVKGEDIFNPDEESEIYRNTYALLFGELSPIAEIDRASKGEIPEEMLMMRAKRGRYTRTWLKEGEKIVTPDVSGYD